MSNNLRGWNAVPYDKRMKPGTRMFMEWAREATARLAGVLEPLPAPTVKAEGVAGGVALSWEEIPNVGVYLCYEADQVGEIDFPFAVVRSKGTGTNGAVKSGALNTDSHFYYVQPVSPLGILGNLSDPVEQGAGSAVDLTGLDDLLLPASIQLLREDFLSGSGLSPNLAGWLGGTKTNTASGEYVESSYPYTGIFRASTATNAAEAGWGLSVGPNASSPMQALGKVWNNPGTAYSDLSSILPYDSLSGWHFIIIFRLPDGPSVVDFNVGFLSQDGFLLNGGSTDSFGLRHRVSAGRFEIFQHRGHGQASQLPPTIHTLEWKDTLTAAAITDSTWHRIDLVSFNGPQEVLRHGSIYLHCYMDGREMGENFFHGTPWLPDTGTGDSGALTRPMACAFSMIKREVSGTTRNLDVDYIAMQFTRAQPIIPILPRWGLEAAAAP